MLGGAGVLEMEVTLDPISPDAAVRGNTRVVLASLTAFSAPRAFIED